MEMKSEQKNHEYRADSGKKGSWLLIGLLVVLTLVLALSLINHYSNRQGQKKDSVRIGVSAYKLSDIFISNMMTSMEQAAKNYELETGVKIYMDIVDANDSQRLQNEQVKRFISFDYDAIAVNPVDRTNMSTIIDDVTTAGIPLVFFNREPVSEDIYREENVYYFGSDAKQTAVLEGEIIVEAFQRDPQKIDKNGDGVIKYVILEGSMGHQDAIIRTEWSVQTLLNHGLNIEKLAGASANFERNQAAVLMEQWYKAYGNEIELVIANNDDMALGAADALQKLNLSGNLAIVGIDATRQGREAVQDGRLLGTVDCHIDELGSDLVKVMVGLGLNGKIPDGIALTNERYIWNDMTKVFYTAE